MKPIILLACQDCGYETPRRGNTQRFCEPCSIKRDAARRKRHDAKPYRQRVRENTLTRGVIKSLKTRSSIVRRPQPPNLSFEKRIAIPYSNAASKNHVFSNFPGGHVAKRKAAVAYREEITRRLSDLRGEFVENKVWIDIFVQKPHNKGDAVNVVDSICDAVKEAIGVDDKWFCLRRVDWEIVKINPMIFIGVGQESNTPVQACSACGSLLSYDRFQRNRATRNGISRNCLECAQDGDRVRRKKRKTIPVCDLFD